MQSVTQMKQQKNKAEHFKNALPHFNKKLTLLL